MSSIPSCSSLNYKFVIDNINKNVKPSFEHAKIKGRSYHHVHGYGIQDRIDTSMLSDRLLAYRKIDPGVLLPSKSDIATLKDEMAILVSQYVANQVHIYVVYS